MLDEEDLAQYKLMFLSPGWKIFRETLENDIANLEQRTLYDAVDERTLYTEKGKAIAIHKILSLEKSILAVEKHEELMQQNDLEFLDDL